MNGVDEAFSVEQLSGMNLTQLRRLWESRYGTPPRHRAADLLRRVLAWRIQAERCGGFDAVTRSLLEQDDKVAPKPLPGTRLAREWAGKRHEVIVGDKGVIYEGVTYGSLSEVARLITGQRWNGPRFFGLRQDNVR